MRVSFSRRMAVAIAALGLVAAYAPSMARACINCDGGGGWSVQVCQGQLGTTVVTATKGEHTKTWAIINPGSNELCTTPPGGTEFCFSPCSVNWQDVDECSDICFPI